MTKQELKDSFDNCKNDKERWKWVIKHKKDGILVNLDNDDTFITIGDNSWYGNFSDYIGWDDGVFVLLNALDIPCSSV